ncbi:MAG: T9SS type A sorting domain-containing protein [Ignavibacteria bacterium]|nr:T9SS type A sorting domain-containing protein [Ignavibacteria bacterium]
MKSKKVHLQGQGNGPLVYPNPSSTEIYIVPHQNDTQATTLTVEIVSIMGETLYSWTGAYTSGIQIQVSRFQPGTYFVRTKWGNAEFRHTQFMVQH